MSTHVTLPSSFPPKAIARYVNGQLQAKRCACSPDCPKIISPSRSYAYGHSPVHTKREAARVERSITQQTVHNTTGLDYEMAKRRAQLELPQVESQIERVDDEIEQARILTGTLQARKDGLVQRHAHLQALIECAEVLTGGQHECSSLSS